eukprot:TRINITY_DN5238_c0_g2_i1.p1 TRINITY_DN5238_c0_g2~~TRINITY_DN5238_c0_g2_i1.p1  ORF type:complete len:446 (-),score=90.72 TRINITY_DN5238_c0_g2_i1:58-1320(-)
MDSKKPPPAKKARQNKKTVTLSLEDEIDQMLPNVGLEAMEDSCIVDPARTEVFLSMLLLSQNKAVMEHTLSEAKSLTKTVSPAQGTSTSPIVAKSREVTIGIHCPFAQKSMLFKVLNDKPMDKMLGLYMVKIKEKLQEYYKTNDILPEDQKIKFTFYGVPVEATSTPQGHGMFEGDLIQVTLPEARTSLAIKEARELIAEVAKLTGTDPSMSTLSLLNRVSGNSMNGSGGDGADESSGDFVAIKVRRADSPQDIEGYRIKKTDTFEKVVNAYARKLGAPVTSIKLFFDGLPLPLKSTPEDHDMEDEDLIDAKYTGPPLSLTPATTTTTITTTTSTPTTTADDGEYVAIKVRQADNPQSFEGYRIKKTDSFEKVVNAYSKKMGVAPSQVTLIFDGLPLPLKSTPEDHDMEDEDLIDARIKN